MSTDDPVVSDDSISTNNSNIKDVVGVSTGGMETSSIRYDVSSIYIQHYASTLTKFETTIDP